ncbi:Hypothetical_protein [Hexamita inflata]|uniref:Hypothetical_protein n=1 Tax=Hexamita inflata TaxID=28002 RepID=A0AA86NCM9_9EUKA|nr:Hypothetical protein HINF_LOCUS4660 [Hexamita inflata]CAI9946185.1 Hypothetical protein HINF_LOCUS33830 [Hexamita inflata]
MLYQLSYNSESETQNINIIRNISDLSSLLNIVNNTIYAKTYDLQEQLNYANLSLYQYVSNVQSTLNTFKTDQNTNINNLQQQINTLFNSKANTVDYYPKAQIDSVLASIQNQIYDLRDNITSNTVEIQNKGYSFAHDQRSRVCVGDECTYWFAKAS